MVKILYFTCGISMHTHPICRRPGYSPDTVVVTDPTVASAYLNKLKGDTIYKNAQLYAQVSPSVYKYKTPFG